MVVEAGLLLVVPADEPDVDVLVDLQLHVVPAVGVMLDQVAPLRRPRREAADDVRELLGSQVGGVGLGVHRLLLDDERVRPSPGHMQKSYTST